MRAFPPVSGIHKVDGQDTGPAQSRVLPAEPVRAWEGTLRPQECSGPGSGGGGSLNAKQSIEEIDGLWCLAGEAPGSRLPFPCGYLWPSWGIRNQADSSQEPDPAGAPPAAFCRLIPQLEECQPRRQ